jgi:hypothetical protein
MQERNFIKIFTLNFKFTFLVTRVWTLAKQEMFTNKIYNEQEFECKHKGML